MKRSDEVKRDIRDRGTIQALLLRFNTQRLPRAEAMKEKVDAGELLNDSDLDLIQQVQGDARQIGGLIERHPEYKELVAGAIEMWTQISEKNAENRKAKK
jgi:hypothetical protein